MLEQLGLRRMASGGEHVALLIEPNGAGEKNLLKKYSAAIHGERNVAVFCNAAFDRFDGVQGILDRL